MKKNILYIGIAVIIGLLGGYILFGNSSDTSNQEISDSHNHSEEGKNQMWTCSMHPQIMQAEAGDCPICGMDLIPAETSAEGLAVNEIKMTENAMALANIQTSIVGAVSAFEEDGMISLSGKIATNEENNSVQVSYFDGRLERLNVSYEGQKVNRGQLLATIYAPNLVAAQQELITAASLKESQPALYKAVRNKLKNWKLSEKQIGAVESSGKVKENFSIYATVSGTVAMVMAAEGDYLKQGQPILKVSNLNSVWAEFDAYEKQISQFKKGQKIKITTSAYPNKEFDAIISFIDPILNNSTRTVIVRTTLKNKENVFKPGMFVTGKIKGAVQAKGASMNIPASALLWTGERSLVYIKTNPNEAIFEMREVTIGVRNGNNYTITAGLENGDEIVTNGTFTVDAAAQLQGKKSMMNKSGGKTMTGHEGHMIDEVEEKINFDASTETSFYDVIDAYIELKDALIKSDVSLASIKSETFRKTLEVIPVSQREKTRNYWSILHKTSKGINKNVDIAHQRKQFQIISDNLIEIVRNFNKLERNLFVQFCPMADNNNGAYWISKEDKVLNPYFGDAMLTCGSVKHKIEKI